MAKNPALKMGQIVAVLLLAIAVVLVSISGCAKTKNKPSEKILRIKGDPMAFVKGAELNGDLGIPLDLFNAEGTWLIDGNTISEREEPGDGDIAQVIAGQDPNGRASDQELNQILSSRAAVEVLDEKTRRIRIGQGVDQIALIFKQGAGVISGNWNLVQVGHVQSKKIERVNEDFRILHTSLRHDRKAVSLLVYSGKPGDSELTNVVLQKLRPDYSASLRAWQVKKATQEKFNYFLKGYRMGWRQQERPLEISVCGEAPWDWNDFPRAEAASWQEALAGRFKFEVVRREKCPPFSDLNHHSFSFVDGYVEVVGGDHAVLGRTLPVVDLEDGRMVDADVFILLDEINEVFRELKQPLSVWDARVNGNDKFRTMVSITVLHELGHVFGLHHVFDGTPSIMSYDDGLEKRLYPYDVEAIRHLYDIPQ